MSGCPALDLVNDASLSGGLRAVDCQINYIVTAAYQRLFGSGGVFGAILTSVLTIYVAFIAYSLLTGRTRASITELAPKVIGIGIIHLYNHNYSLQHHHQKMIKKTPTPLINKKTHTT